MLLGAISFLLGAAELPPRDLGIIVIGIGQLIGMAASVVAIIAAFRRQPPIGEQLHQSFATKEEVDTIRTEAAASIRRVHERIDELTQELNRHHSDSERARGLMMGKLESITEVLRTLHDDIKDRRL